MMLLSPRREILNIFPQICLNYTIFLYLFCNNIQRWYEELIADERQRVEHVNDSDDMQSDGAMTQFVIGKQVFGEQRVVRGGIRGASRVVCCYGAAKIRYYRIFIL